MPLFLLIIFLLFSFASIKFKKDDILLEKNTTTALRGIAIFGIVIAHLLVLLYGEVKPNYEIIIRWFFTVIAPIGVAIFLFLSGYGCTLSLQKNNSIMWLCKKISRIYITCGIFLAIEYLVAFFLGMDKSFFPHSYSFIKDVLFLTPPPRALGWYLIVQTIGYITLFFSLKRFRNFYQIPLYLFWVFFVITCIILRKQGCWWVSSLCFPLGVSFAQYADKIQDFIKKFPYKLSIISVLMVIVLFIASHELRAYGILLLTPIVCIAITNLSIIVALKSKILQFLGKYSLEIYLLHALCIFFFSRISFNIGYEINIKILLTILLTIGFALPLYTVCNRISLIIFGEKNAINKIR